MLTDLEDVLIVSREFIELDIILERITISGLQLRDGVIKNHLELSHQGRLCDQQRVSEFSQQCSFLTI